MTDLTESQQNVYGAKWIIGFRDGSQTLAPSNYTKYPQFFLTGVSVTGRILTLPAVAALKNFTADVNNGYPVTVKLGTTEITIDPGQVKTLQSDGTANGLSDETGSPALAGFSNETPLPDAGVGDPGSSIFPARADHVHPLGSEGWQTVTHADSPVSLISGGRYDFDTRLGPITATLDGDPDKFDEVFIRNGDQSFASYPLTVAHNGNPIMGLAQDMTFNTDGDDTSLWFNGTSWQFPGAQL